MTKDNKGGAAIKTTYKNSKRSTGMYLAGMTGKAGWDCCFAAMRGATNDTKSHKR